jgi:acetyltransferase-like isoleucine patch superfamily enzyme
MRNERNRGTTFAYWLLTALANTTGRIPSHTIRGALYRNIYKMKLPKNSVLYGGCRFFCPWRIVVGSHSIIGDHSFLDGRMGIKIGNNVNISLEARIFTLEHDIESPTFEAKGGPVLIEDRVYLGSRVTILPGVKIGEGAVVASGAVVTKNVESWTMVGGVPAEFIRERPQVRYTLDTKNKALFH